MKKIKILPRVAILRLNTGSLYTTSQQVYKVFQELLSEENQSLILQKAWEQSIRKDASGKQLRRA